MEKTRVDDIIKLNKADLRGKLLCFPTDTVYGLGALYGDREAIERIYVLKNRSHDKPIANLCAGIDQVEELGIEITPLTRTLIARYWPGPLTIIFPTPGGKVSFRMPDCQPALKLLRRFGPLATTSVNESGEPELNDYRKIEARFGQHIDYFITDPWDFTGTASTVIDITGDVIRVIREGSIKF
jgi:L-threonylcarbamoyladenylate synthase